MYQLDKQSNWHTPKKEMMKDYEISIKKFASWRTHSTTLPQFPSPLPINQGWAAIKHLKHIPSRKGSPSPISLSEKYRRFKRQWLAVDAKVFDFRSSLKDHLYKDKHGRQIYQGKLK